MTCTIQGPCPFCTAESRLFGPNQRWGNGTGKDVGLCVSDPDGSVATFVREAQARGEVLVIRQAKWKT